MERSCVVPKFGNYPPLCAFRVINCSLASLRIDLEPSGSEEEPQIPPSAHTGSLEDVAHDQILCFRQRPCYSIGDGRKTSNCCRSQRPTATESQQEVARGGWNACDKFQVAPFRKIL